MYCALRLPLFALALAISTAAIPNDAYADGQHFWTGNDLHDFVVNAQRLCVRLRSSYR